jgi:hypothetical protein
MYPAISRLSARITDLEAKGWVFRTESDHGDYAYIVAEMPEPPRPASPSFSHFHQVLRSKGKSSISPERLIEEYKEYIETFKV